MTEDSSNRHRMLSSGACVIRLCDSDWIVFPQLRFVVVVVALGFQVGLKRLSELAEIVPQTSEVSPLLRPEDLGESTSKAGDVQKMLSEWLPL